MGVRLVHVPPRYFSPKDFSTGKKSSPSYPLVRGFVVGVFFHLGTLALGAFLIATCKLLRLVLGYIAKQSQQTGNQVMATIAKIMVEFCGRELLMRSTFCGGQEFLLLVVDSVSYPVDDVIFAHSEVTVLEAIVTVKSQCFPNHKRLCRAFFPHHQTISTSLAPQSPRSLARLPSALALLDP